MTPTEHPAVALVDWFWTGHHPMYFRMLLKGFRDCGAQVLAICTEKAIEETKEWLAREPNSEALLDGVDFLPIRQYRERERLPHVIRGWEQGRRTFGSLTASIKQWENETKDTVDLVFFATIYDQQFENFRHARNVFHYPWSGIYLHARSFRIPDSPIPYSNRMPCPEKIFTVASMSSVCVLDEGAVTPMKILSGGKPVFEFPDITDCTIEEPLSGETLAGKVKSFANGRRIVACLGHLQKTKGIYELCLAARDPRLHDVCFFFGGEVNWAEMSPAEIQIVQATWEQCPNVMTHLLRISSDAVMNEVILAADIVFAAYTNFPNSSNIMTKSAQFETPIIVSDGYLMAERVRKHQTGTIVPEGNIAAITHAIRSLLDQPAIPQNGYRDYSKNHSEEKMLSVLARVLDAAG